MDICTYSGLVKPLFRLLQTFVFVAMITVTRNHGFLESLKTSISDVLRLERTRLPYWPFSWQDNWLTLNVPALHSLTRLKINRAGDQETLKP